MQENLEEKDPKVEEIKPTSSKEVAKSTHPEVEPTVRTYDQKEFDTAVGKGLASVNTQLSLQKQAAETAKAEVEAAKADVVAIEAELKALQGEHDELVGKQFTDPEERQTYFASLRDKRAFAEERSKLAKEKVDVEKKHYEAEKLAWSVAMARKADALVKETGIDPTELEACQTEEEMEVKALRFKIGKEPAGSENTPQFDSLISSGVGLDPSKMSPDEKLKYGFRQLGKKK